MISSHEFNPFNILPRELMLHILLHTFTTDGKESLEVILNYKKANKEFRSLLSDEGNFKYIMDSMPTEFNIAILPSLRTRMTVTEEGRYRAGLALLFLKYLYEQIKPFPDDEFLLQRFDDYYLSLEYLQEFFTDYPMPMYIGGYVAYYIAKRLMIINPLDKELRKKAAQVYKISVHCINRAHELEHPLAQIFYADMVSQLQRDGINIEEHIKVDLPDIPSVDLDLLSSLLSNKHKINVSFFPDEIKTLILVTWQKLIIENYSKACDLFYHTFQYEKLVNLTEYLYNCYEINHFHRHVLAYNPLFVHSDKKENIIYLLQVFSVDELVAIHQGFRVYQPQPDSVLLSTMLNMDKDELKQFRILVNEMLTLPQKGSSGWRACFLDAYRNAIDDGSLKVISSKQMKSILKYLILVGHASKIDTILERDAEIINYILHCKNDKVHDLALAVIEQLLTFNRMQPLGQLDQQEIILRAIYQDAIHLSTVKIKGPKDLDRMATIFDDTYAAMIAPNVPIETDFKVYDYMFKNREKFSELLQAIHIKFIESGYMRAA
jgi:hypothetical protein